LHDQRLCVLRRTGGPGFLCRGLQICEALRRLRRHHVVTSIEWSGQWFPSEIQRRPDCRSTLPVLKQSWFNRCATEQARLLAPPALTRAIGTPFLARDDSSEMSPDECRHAARMQEEILGSMTTLTVGMLTCGSMSRGSSQLSIKRRRTVVRAARTKSMPTDLCR